MKKKILFVICLLIIAGCDSINIKTKTKGEFYTGFKGLEISFMDNTPPERVYLDSDFPVIFEIRNSGAFDIEKDDNKVTDGVRNDKAVVLLSIEKDYNNISNIESTAREFKFSDTKKELGEFYIEGKTPLTPKGGEAIVAYTVNAKNLNPQSETLTATLIGTLCYPYRTKISTNICIDTDQFGIIDKNKVCKIKDIDFPQGQGAPLAITKIETRMQSINIDGEEFVIPNFIIHVKNMGGGEVFRDKKVHDICSSNPLDPYDKDFNTLYVKASLSGDTSDKESLLECEPADPQDKEKTGYVRLQEGEDLVRCRVKADKEHAIKKNVESYISPLTIEMDYGYTKSISKSYVIERSVVE